MTCKSNEAWVTGVSNNENGTKALILANSLRRSFTTKSLIVIVSGTQISPGILNALRLTFDGVFMTNQGSKLTQGGNELPKEVYSKLFAWTLTLFSKCVFVESDFLVLRNCDELFDIDLKEEHLAINGNGTIFVFHPNLNKFQNLLDNSDSDLFEQIIFNTFGSGGIQEIPKNFNISIGDDSKPLEILDEIDCKIVRVINGLEMTNTSTKITSKSCGLLENSIWKYWLEIYQKHVLPSLDASNKVHKSETVWTSTSSTSTNEDAIAIIGMSCRFPKSNSIPEFWDLLINGKDGISSNSKYFRGGLRLPGGFLSSPYDEFDGKFFGISPAEVSYLDPQGRLLLEVIWEALEDAGIDAQELYKSRTGVFTGIWTQDYRELLNQESGPTEEYFRKYMGNGFGSISGRISHLLGLTGPNISTESGCSSSMIAVDLACQSLKSGSCNIAFASGANLIIQNFQEGIEGLIAPDGHCKTFDADANGYGRGEGCATLVLKRYSEAIKDGDKVLALIKGIGVAQEGISRSFGTPTVEVEATAMNLALKNAKVSPCDVSYVEVHGTGTPVGDPLEISAINSVYGNKGRSEPLLLGSVKTNIGHCESCSGIAGIIKTVLALQHEMIPPHLNLNKVNPLINLDEIPAQIPTSPCEWPKTSKPRIAGVNCFGITGTDAHAIIQEPPTREQRPLSSKLNLNMTPRPQHVLTLSAKSDDALDALLNKYQEFFTNDPEEPLGDICYSVNTGRTHFPKRIALKGKTKGDILKKITTGDYLRSEVTPKNNEPSKICFLFTGQGSHYPEIGQILYKTCPLYRLHFDYCDSILKKNYQGISVLNIPKDISKLSQSLQSIYAIIPSYFQQICLMKLWKSWGVTPGFILGHSLGEYAAAVCAGIMEMEDGLKLLIQRARSFDTLTLKGKMLVVKSNRETVGNLIKDFLKGDPREVVEFAAVNTNSQVVLSGLASSIDKFTTVCRNNQIPCQELPTLHPYHSSLMSPIQKQCVEITETIEFSEPKCPYISGITGELLKEGDFNPEYLGNHLTHTVEFMKASQTALSQGCNIFIEIGPQPILSSFVVANKLNSDMEMTCLPSLRKGLDDWTVMLESISKLYVQGAQINWKSFDQYMNRTRVLSPLPSYPFQRRSYWYEKSQRSSVPYGSLGIESVHPLIGNLLPSVSPSKVFQSVLKIQDIPYVKDHCIGSQVLLPGSGYLEMALCAGHMALTGMADNESVGFPEKSFRMENLRIDAPLELKDNESYVLQTLVEFQGSPSQSNVSIFKMQVPTSSDKNEGGPSSDKVSWVKHSFGKFSVTSRAEPLPSNKIYLTEAPLKEIESKCGVEVDPEGLYEKLNTLGQNFGSFFKSLKTLRKSEDNLELLAKVVFPIEDFDKYFIHPVILDAMIQAFCLTKFSTMDDLHVPVGIGRFTWYAGVTSGSTSGLIHSFWEQQEDEEDPKIMTVLYDSTGKLLGILEDVQLIRTSLSALKNALNKNRMVISVGIYEEVWRERMGPLSEGVELDKSSGEDLIFSKGAFERLEELTKLNENQEEVYERTQRLCYLYVLRALYQLNWSVLGSKSKVCFTFDQVISDHLPEVQRCHYKLLRRLFQILEEEGMLYKSIGDKYSRWNFDPEVKSLLKVSQVEEQVSLLTESFKGDTSMEALLSCGDKLKSLLEGQESALEILFTEDTLGNTRAFQMYTGTSRTLLFHSIADPLLHSLFKNYLTLDPEKRGVIRILEVGAGTGAGTEPFLQALEALGVKYEFTFSDISSAFFTKGQKRLESYKDKMLYKTLNIEEDPLTQGFIPKQFDIILALFVIHATKSLEGSLGNLRLLLKDQGTVLLTENAKPVREFDLTFGLVEGYWRFEDFDLRPHHCIAHPDDWKRAFLSQGYGAVQDFTFYMEDSCAIVAKAVPTSMSIPVQNFATNPKSVWVVFCNELETLKELKGYFAFCKRGIISVKDSLHPQQNSEFDFEIRSKEKLDMELLFSNIRNLEGEKSFTVEGILYAWTLGRKEMTQEEVIIPYANLVQVVSKIGLGLGTLKHPVIYVAAQGMNYIEDQVPPEISPSSLVGINKCWRTEGHPVKFGSLIDLDPQALNMEQLFTELWGEVEEEVVAYRRGKRFVKRSSPVLISKEDASLTLPNSEGYKLKLPQSQSIDDLSFESWTFQSGSLKDYEVEVEVKATGLNFRDVLVVLKPTEDFKNYNSMGSDFSGLVTKIGSKVTQRKVGDSVFGMNFFGEAMPSLIRLPEGSMMTLPETMTFCEGATLPTVFLTVYQCLVKVAELKSNETILIHTASGGVGLAAIQIAKAIGAKIIATAGSNRKRSYLRSIGLEHVFHSRNTNFEQEIQRVTLGQGVNVVLNSLTGPGFKEASLKCLTHGGKFVEMSKLDIWTEDEVKGGQNRPDVKYEIVDLTALSVDLGISTFQVLEEYLASGKLVPLPYQRFDIQGIREALTFLRKAKQIGKVVVTFPDRRFMNGQYETKSTLFNNRSSYLITGAFGGVGLETTKWMIDQGAAYLILVGRNPPNKRGSKVISQLRARGVQILCQFLDIGDSQKCSELFAFIKNPSKSGFPKLRGVMHAAGTLQDVLMDKMSWPDFEKTFRSKVKGTWNLHEETKHLPLEHFVLFSSVAALIGNASQATHASANGFMDSVAIYRHSIGLPALTVNWGQWGEVGVAAGIKLTGITPFSPAQAFGALELLMKGHKYQASVENIEHSILKLKYPLLNKYFEEIKSTEGDYDLKEGGGSQRALLEGFLEAYECEKDVEKGKLGVVMKHVEGILRTVLKLEVDEVVDDDQNFLDMGMDSLMMIEMKNCIQIMTKGTIILDTAAMTECQTVRAMSNYIYNLLLHKNKD